MGNQLPAYLRTVIKEATRRSGKRPLQLQDLGSASSICDGSRPWADRLLIGPARWARPGSTIWGQVSSKARNSGRIRSESPSPPTPILAAAHPGPPGTTLTSPQAEASRPGLSRSGCLLGRYSRPVVPRRWLTTGVAAVLAAAGYHRILGPTIS